MAPKKITIAELNRKLVDPAIREEDLRAYFTIDETRSGPFAPAAVYNPATVDLSGMPDAVVRGEMGLGIANWLARMRRRVAFENRISDGSYKGPIIVSEGDSWFQYPFVLEDVIDHLMRDFAILSLDAGGDTLENMLRESEFLEPIRQYGASIFLISGGGNDLVADGFLAEHLRDFDPALAPADYLLPSFGALVDTAIRQYDQIFRTLETRFPQLSVVCHGYDRPVPRPDGKWLGKPMARRGIADPGLQKAIAGTMIDRFNTELGRLARGFPRVTCLDLRAVVRDDRWHDELHPVDAGYGDVAARFRKAIGVLAAPKAAPQPAARAKGKGKAKKGAAPPAGLPLRQAISLHIGLNEVDPAHYAGWVGELAACEFDAEDMEAIARSCGFAPTRLATPAATRAAVVGAIRDAAGRLKAGDIFLVSYSGHGGQVPDFNADEEDALDETWCLYDGQLIDDELYALWAEFREGVRILVVSDSCHSGSVIKQMAEAGSSPALHAVDDEGYLCDPQGNRARAMPYRQSVKVFRQNRDFYEKLGRSIARTDTSLLARELVRPVAATVRLLSGCQDNQFSYDGFDNGQFTGALLAVWNEGRFEGDYDAFHQAILNRMPAIQTPNHWQVGQPNAAFDGQKPFAV
ncbi:caspase family protein [Stella sp.]|uniref:caspase family protein n=1 Tax=Stella sp. TaxID=2912054 RepID=UPI0035B20C2E